jgi:hypothetical protein
VNAGQSVRAAGEAGVLSYGRVARPMAGATGGADS